MRGFAQQHTRRTCITLLVHRTRLPSSVHSMLVSFVHQHALGVRPLHVSIPTRLHNTCFLIAILLIKATAAQCKAVPHCHPPSTNSSTTHNSTESDESEPIFFIHTLWKASLQYLTTISFNKMNTMISFNKMKTARRSSHTMRMNPPSPMLMAFHQFPSLAHMSLYSYVPPLPPPSPTVYCITRTKVPPVRRVQDGRPRRRKHGRRPQRSRGGARRLARRRLFHHAVCREWQPQRSHNHDGGEACG
jgi:hypothetical protein